MLKKTFPLLLLALCYVFPVNADEFTFASSESIGEFRLGLTAQEVQNKIHCRLKKRPDILWRADSFYHQTWDCYKGGISFDMVSKSKGGIKTIAHITINTPSKLKTKRGIHVGSTEQEVIQAYGNEKNADATQAGEIFVAGSVFDGLVFQFKNGLVESISLNAGSK